MNNIPEVKVGIVAVSRDCFPESLSVNRRKALVEAYAAKYDVKNLSLIHIYKRHEVVYTDDYRASRLQRGHHYAGRRICERGESLYHGVEAGFRALLCRGGARFGCGDRRL